ncbi:hypothetical protein EJ08DRAFT_650294 [Tothia fuscella]|uniref:Glycoside hydrolase 131 catalytic N-terminal domain-containing protein n=1 Tax=Tothia fuscella TaxID=1048955 RepID=A0A9P4NQJ3_9PEZI|nr:hypothetical protein EJ08DRAFT_650294 [Tothia fuscella]
MLPLIFGIVPFLLSHQALAQPYTPICKVVLDGRIPLSATPATFDAVSPANPFNPTYARSTNLKWSQILRFPTVTPSVFDWQSKPIEVTINDKSIYNNQKGIRRAGLVFSANSGTDDITNAGVKTFHWSVKQPPVGARPLNLTHEYMNVFHVRQDDKGFQFQFTVGDAMKPKDPRPFTHFRIIDKNENVAFSTLISFKEWQNFAVTLDYNRNVMRIYYSTGNDELKEVVGERPNDNSGKGRFQVGIFKKPTDVSPDVNTYLNTGFQEADFEESQIYGGIYVEDSAGNCITK